jgi:serine protease AprX
MKLRVLTVLILVASMFASAHSSASGLQQAGRFTSAKIAPWVLAHTADGKEAEFLVVLADQADLSAAEKLQTKEEKGWYVYKTLFEKAQVTQQPILDWLKVNGVEHRSYYIVNMIWVKGKIDVAQALAARADVARVEGNPNIRNVPEPIQSAEGEKPFSPETVEGGIAFTRAPEVWAVGFKGAGIVVGGADTGYRWDHTALKPHYRGFDGVTTDHNFNWHDSIHSGGGSCGANSPVPCDDFGHGTHTMGTSVGDDGGVNQIGMAPQARWIGCRNMNQGFGTPATYTECFEFFLAPYPVGGTPAQGNPSKAPHVTINSWGCPPSEGCSATTLQAGVEAQRAAGIMMVVSAGNSGSGCSSVVDPPAIYDAAYTVGAISHSTGNIAGFSSRGPVTIDGSNRLKPDITAPGVGTRSSTSDTTTSYDFSSGTSMAGPHVAGAVALLWSARPDLIDNVTETEGYLNETAVHVNSAQCNLNGVPNNTYGWGRLDVKAAVDLALTTVAPASAVAQRGGGKGAAVVTAPTTATPWTAVSNDAWIILTSPTGGTGSGLVTYEVRENFTGHLRVGTVTIARRTFTILQSGFAAGICNNSIAPAGSGFESGGGPGSLTVTAGPECAWTATTKTGWITVTSGAVGIGNGSVNYTVEQNTTGSARKGTIIVAGRTFNVKQK